MTRNVPARRASFATSALTLGLTRSSAPASTASRARAAVVTVPRPRKGGPSPERAASSSRRRLEAPGTVKVISTSSRPEAISVRA